MEIVLLYPPPWKIAPAGMPAHGCPEGPPEGCEAEPCLSGDILSIPYGLLSLAAQARAARHTVTVYNLYTFAWADVESIIALQPARLFGLSCFTSNRRGTVYTAELIRRLHPEAHIVAGGPHAAALPRELLAHCRALDTVVVGEGEETFMELCARLESGGATAGIAGTVWRGSDGPAAGPARPRIEDLDRLVPPCRYYNEYILVTSRGCRWDCSFCASAGIWGRVCRHHSPGAVLDMLDTIVNVNGQTAVAIKDETFTDDRRRVMQLCEGIRRRNVRFLWSCDTRADQVDEEMLSAMRQAGCQRISLGLESASPEILRRMHKGIRPEDAASAVVMAQQYGFEVRVYMIAGSPGETLQTLRESLAFIERVRPNQVIFNPATLLPGTRDYAIAEQAGTVCRDVFFTQDFFELTFDRYGPADSEKAQVAEWLARHQGLQQVAAYTVAERTRIVERFPGLAAAHLDLASACCRHGAYVRAEHHARLARKLGYPRKVLLLNCCACIAAGRGDVHEALEHLLAARDSGYARVVEDNLEAVRRWAASGAAYRKRPLVLKADVSFEVTRPLQQPVTPGPITITDRSANTRVFAPRRFCAAKIPELH